MGDLSDSSMEIDEIEGNSTKYKPSFVLCAIDTHSSMFISEDSPSPFRNCINALYKISDYLLLKSDKRGWSPFSVVLFNEDNKSSLIDFNDNMINTTKLLKEKSKLNETELKNQYMRDKDVDLAAFFQLCKKKFKNISSTYYKRIMIFITNDNDPVNSDPNKRFTALNEAKRFEENDIIFQLVVTNQDFQFNKFYDELFTILNKEKIEIICEDEEGLFEKLSNTIWLRHTQRKMKFYPFPNDTTKYLSMYMKSYHKTQRLLNNHYVGKDGTPVVRIKQKTDEPVIIDEFFLKHKKSKNKILNLKFNLAEKIEVNKTKFPIGLTLMYVSDRITEIGVVLGEPKILEEDNQDTMKLFTHFWQYCVNNNQVLICVRVSRKNDKPRGVELIPKLHHGIKVFLMKQIPFATDIFEPEPRESKTTFTEQQIKVTDTLIDNLSSDFSITYLINEKFTRKENYVKAKLLDEPRKDINMDLMPTNEQIDEKLGEIMYEYKNIFPQEPPKQGTKRKIYQRKKF